MKPNHLSGIGIGPVRVPLSQVSVDSLRISVLVTSVPRSKRCTEGAKKKTTVASDALKDGRGKAAACDYAVI